LNASLHYRVFTLLVMIFSRTMLRNLLSYMLGSDKKLKYLSIYVITSVIIILTLPLLFWPDQKGSKPPLAIRYNMQGNTSFPWKDDPQCSHFAIRFAEKDSLPLRALVSHPGSGNTLVRTLVESLTGVFTGYDMPYNPVDSSGLWRYGFLGETTDFRDGSTILQKSHHVRDPFFNVQQFQGRGIVIIRNPFDAIMSTSNYVSEGEKKLGLPVSINYEFYQSEYFEANAFIQISVWYELVKDWLDYGEEVDVIFFEELIENPMEVIVDLLNKLGIHIEEERKKCFIKHLGELKEFAHRTTHHKIYPYTTFHNTVFRALIDDISQRLQKRIGRPLPLEKYNNYKINDYKVNFV